MTTGIGVAVAWRYLTRNRGPFLGLTLFAVLALCPSTSAHAQTYGYFKGITIDRTRIPGGCGATLSGYPLLFSVTDPDLAHTGSGGRVTDLQGDDIIFRALDDATCGGVGLAPCTLDHEIEKYVSGTGQMVAWVRIPSVNTASAGSDTRIYVYYGNSAVTSSTQNVAGVWDASYRAVWHLEEPVTDEATTGTHDDSTSNNNDGTQGGNDDAAGRIAEGQDFDAVDDHVAVGSGASIDDVFAGGGTIEAWIFPTGWGEADFGRILDKSSGTASSGGWSLRLDNSNVPGSALDFEHSHATADGVWEASSSITLSQWQHVVVVYDRDNAANEPAFYVNGVLQATTETTAPAGAPDSDAAQSARIGNVGDATSRTFDGIIDEVRISDVSRSSCWIRANFENQDDPGDVGAPGFYTVGLQVLTAVELLSFSAGGRDEAVDLLWETGSEIGNLGFHLYRSPSSDGPFERITAALIPGLGSSPEGARYAYRDAGLVNGTTYFYELEDVETTGRTERHGPVSALPVAGESPTEEDGDAEDAPEAASRTTYGDPGSFSFRVLERSRRHALVELRTGGFYATPLPDGSVRLEAPLLQDVSAPGQANVPALRTWIEAVAGRKVRIASVHARDVQSFSLRPEDAPARELRRSRDGTHRLVSRRARGGVRASTLYPEAPARILSTAFQGEVKKARLEMAPLRYDGRRGKLFLARTLRARVFFAGREPDEVSWGGTRGRKRRRLPPEREDVLARLAVREPGLYAVSFEDVFGRVRRGLRALDVGLSRQGKPVPFNLEPSTGRFGPGSRLFFVSEGAALNPFAQEAVYELTRSHAGQRMPRVDAGPSGDALLSYLDDRRFEVDRLYQATLRDPPDRWLWDYIVSPAAKAYPFTLSGPSGSGVARLTVDLHGTSDVPETVDHHLRVSVNGVLAAEASWDSQEAYTVEAEVASALLRDGDNQLEIQNLGAPGVSSVVALDRFRLRYPRPIAAESGRLMGVFESSGSASVAGLPAASYLLDVTDQTPRWLTGAVASPQGLAFRVEAASRYLVVAPEATLKPQVVLPATSSLRSKLNQADYLVVTPREFLPAAGPLVEHRRAQGLTAMAVPIEEVYDEFGFGETSPQALREFLAFAYHEWSPPSPRYVLLLGDASYDPKDFLGRGHLDRVPGVMVQTQFLWTISDPAYASVNGDDDVPDLALGRLSAASLAEASALVDKVLVFERAGFTLSGPRVLVADNADAGGAFEQNADEIAAGLLGGQAEKIYVGSLGGGTRAAIHDALNRGASTVSYIGHGSTLVWASENVFNNGDLPQLVPQPEQPLLFTMNCLNGYFHMPGLSALAEAFVKAEGRGAIAALAPSGLSLDGPAHVYHKAVLQEILSGRHRRLGDALLAAQVRYVETGVMPELLGIYHLLGDPALELRF